VSNGTYHGLLGLAECCTWANLAKILDNRRREREISNTCVTASAVVATSP
jgi:hypothetical protein